MKSQTSSSTKTKTMVGCCSKVGLKRGPWTVEEDELLSEYIKKEGEGRWRTLPSKAGLLRCGKSCRLRWMNYLRPSVKRGHITPDEEDLILRLHRLLGNRWSLIAGRIPGRTDNEIKNYWNTHLSKKLIGRGINPRTHRPLALIENNNNKMHTTKTTLVDSKTNDVHVKVEGTNNLHRHNDDIGTSNDIDNNNHSNKSIGCGIKGSNNESMTMNDCCADDMLSSFFNSLLNEDTFISTQNNQLLSEIFDPSSSYYDQMSSFPFPEWENSGFQPWH